jgi:heme-degrading monooxygenase HmoA
MFPVLFEVQPYEARWNDYLNIAKDLKPTLQQIPGFIRNVRYRSFRRKGWILSLSDWEDEKALIRWRVESNHHHAQENGRFQILEDYHLRVGEISTTLSTFENLETYNWQRYDLTQVGEGQIVTLLETTKSAEWVENTSNEEIVRDLGFEPSSTTGVVSWDIFEAVLTRGNLILLCTWQNALSADTNTKNWIKKEGNDLRAVRVVRDYGKYDRREAPQYHPRGVFGHVHTTCLINMSNKRFIKTSAA